ncbi:MAG: AIPR family protein [Acidobacteriaceae bacterium]
MGKGELGSEFDHLNNSQRSRQMIIFFVSEILDKLIPGIVPDDGGEVESCIIDGSGDGGADFLYRTDDGQVLIIQAKYRGSKDQAESAESVGRCCDLLERLYLAAQGKQGSLHKELLELAGQIDWEQDTFRVYFITTGKSGDAVTDRVEQGLVSISNLPDFDDRSEFRYLDLNHLNQEMRNAFSSAEFSAAPIEISMIADANNRYWCHFEGQDRELYVGEVSGSVLASKLEQHKASLFTMNIRDYVGDTKTNKQIIKTALTNPTDFEYFNNGRNSCGGTDNPRRTNGQTYLREDVHNQRGPDREISADCG